MQQTDLGKLLEDEVFQEKLRFLVENNVSIGVPLELLVSFAQCAEVMHEMLMDENINDVIPREDNHVQALAQHLRDFKGIVELVFEQAAASEQEGNPFSAQTLIFARPSVKVVD